LTTVVPPEESMRALPVGSGLLVVLLGASPMTRAQGPTIDHKGVGCVVADRFPSLEAKVTPQTTVARARVYFRAAGAPFWYFVEMKAQEGSFWAALPKPKKSLKRLDYYIEAVDTALSMTRTAEFSPAVESDPSECSGKLTAAAALPAAAIKVGLAVSGAGAPAFPVGFASSGAVAASSASAGTAGGTAAAGGSTKAIILGTVGVAAVSGGVAAAVQQGDGAPPGTTLGSGSAQVSAGPSKMFVLVINNACSWVGEQPPVRSGDLLTFVTGVGQWPTPAEAATALEGTSASIVLDGVSVPLRYQGITQHQAPGGGLGGYGNQAMFDWVATPGAHSVYGGWSYPGARDGTCSFTVQ
jgi:hypothetical protein